MLVLGQVMYDVLFPSFVAGIIGFHVASQLGVTYPNLTAKIIPPVTGWSFTEMIMLGIWCGVIALVFIELMQLSHRLFARLSWPSAGKAVLGWGGAGDHRQGNIDTLSWTRS